MSKRTGTGSPVFFRCGALRKVWPRTLADAREHRVELTGRSRPYHSKRRHSLGPRSTSTSYEYQCSCGHVGWSNHIDLARLAGVAS